ncbi:putative kynureninase [Tothia fuscella]|uniref:Kynureninase n=1 Tax=Tothia fuscella TaxID=1048955 RepID=A0A9P4TUG1_9PEZI|nr:putative kynureninase [Tothia fuscella]
MAADFGANPQALTQEYAKELDTQDPLRHIRDEFLIPTRGNLKRKSIANDTESSTPSDSTPSTYLCGNSLGLQPKRTRTYLDSYLSTWSQFGVHGHFKEMQDAKTLPWVNIDEQTSEGMCKIVGALKGEVAVMQSLTANLHFSMASFYRPSKERWKIIIEGKAFPSDHYAVYSHLSHHNLDPADSLILIEPSDAETHYFGTQHILDTIAEHAETTALLLLPGVHYYTGQYLDIATITSFAQSKGITVGWDLAHAAGNIPLHLHDWNVDFAAWCSYKYLNAGAGAIAGLFVHEKHGRVTKNEKSGVLEYTPRLSGWWGNDKDARFRMERDFVPMVGAAGWQLSNPSVLDCTSLCASLAVFGMTDMGTIRAKSVKLTGYLEFLLHNWHMGEADGAYSILTPSNPEERGAQISVRLKEGLLETVMEVSEEEGVVVDERRPDVVRVAPAPLYNSFGDVWRFVSVFERALKVAIAKKKKKKKGSSSGGGTMVDGPSKEKGWGDVT